MVHERVVNFGMKLRNAHHEGEKNQEVNARGISHYNGQPSQRHLGRTVLARRFQGGWTNQQPQTSRHDLTNDDENRL